MTRTNCLLATFVAVFFSSSVWANLTLCPTKIDLGDVSQSKKVFIKRDGIPVLPTEIKKVVSGVYKYRDDVPEGSPTGTHFSNYSYMFKFQTNDDGSITITPKESSLQIGTYDLYVHTIYGTATGSIDVNLKESLPAKPLNPVKHPEFSYAIELPDYSYGQLISIDLGPDGSNTYFWYIDGEVHSSGLGETSFRARPEPGVHEISYIARNSEGIVVSSWSDTIEVSK